MRICGFILLLIGSAVAVATTLDTPRRDSAAEQTERVWVRTIDGWQSLASLNPEPRVEPTLHPFAVAGFLTLSSLLVLFAFDRDSAPQSPDPASKSTD